MEHTKKIAAGIIERDGTVLIAQRAKPGPDCGKWEFPGGKVEHGETLQECLARELFEELGIITIVGDYVCSSFFMHNGMQYEMRAFKVTSFTGEIILHEHSQMAWVTPRELSNYIFPEPDAPIIEILQR